MGSTAARVPIRDPPVAQRRDTRRGLRSRSPVQLSADPTVAGRLLDLVPSIPTPVRGRDELRAGEMWNSNSVTSWLLSRTATPTEDIRPPGHGRAPGWDAGLTVADRIRANSTHAQSAVLGRLPTACAAGSVHGPLSKAPSERQRLRLVAGAPAEGGGHMRVVVRWIIVAAFVSHGLIHLLGAAEGLRWTDVPQLTRSMSTGAGIAWLAIAALFVATGLFLARSVRWWWMVGAVALVTSQALIFTAWSDARAGSVTSVVLLMAVAYGYASQGPTSYRSEFRHRSRTAARRTRQQPGRDRGRCGKPPRARRRICPEVRRRRPGSRHQPPCASLAASAAAQLRGG